MGLLICMLIWQHKFSRFLILLFPALFFGWDTMTLAQSADAPPVPLVPDINDNSDLIDELRLKWELSGVQSALSNGFLKVADTLSQKLLAQPDLTQSARARLLNDRLQICLLQGDLGQAQDVINQLRQAGQPDPLMEAFYLFFSGNRRGLSQRMAQLGFLDLDEEQLAWFRLLQALVLNRDGRLEEANQAFAVAEAAAPNVLIRDQFELIRLREDLESGRADSVTISALRESVRSMQGERGGFEAARLLAEALRRAGETDQAVEVLNSQLAQPGLREFNLRSEFLLLMGNIAGAGSARGRLALREIINEPSSPLEHQSLALTQLAQAISNPQDRDAFLIDLETWLAAPAPHPLADRFLAFRSYFRAEMGDFEEAGRSAQALLERYPNSVFIANALRMLAYTSWNQTPPRYRTAAGYLNQLRQQFPQGDDSMEAGILIADCYFLNGDYANAADMYGAILRDAPGELAPGIFFQRILSEIRSNRIALAGELVDEFRRDPRISDEMIWKAEWNLLDHMRRSGQSPEANNRIQDFLRMYRADSADISDSLAIRFRWLEARLTLEAGPAQDAIALAKGLLEELAGKTTGFDDAYLLEVRSHLLLLQGEAEIASGQRDAGIATFAQLRNLYPNSGPTVLSYLVESRSESAADSLVSAQQSLIALVDRFPNSEYAPIALWEAALNAEQRGLNIHLQEAITILERLVSAYPGHHLVYYARLKQGDLARRLNDFPTALLLYERLLTQYQEHPERYRVEMSRADCLMALGSEDSDRFDQAAVVYERNCLLPVAPLPIRVEAGFKWAHALRQQNDISGCEAVYWLLYDRFVQDEDLSESVVHAEAGRYWLSRILLELGSLQLEQGEVATARQVYQTLLQMKLPGAALAQARLDSLRQQG